MGYDFPGMGVLLSSGSDVKLDDIKGKTIRFAKLVENKVFLQFTDGTRIKLYDDGQSCCENRYISTDDEMNNIEDGLLLDIEKKEGPIVEKDCEVHEQIFVEIKTDKGFVTLCTHNEHNGYYGGFALVLQKDEE
jgi:hypothetical protein